jgi:MFS family permease
MLRRLLVLVSAVVLVDVLFYSAITPLLPHYTDELGLSKSEAGLLGGAYAAGNLVTAIPTGWLAGRYGPRRMLLVGLALLTAACVAFGVADSYELLVGARFVQGVGGACAWAAGMGWLIAAAPVSRRGEVIGTALGVAIAGALGGPVIGALAEAIGTEPVFSAIAVIAAILAVLVLREAAPPETDTPGGLREAFADRRVLAGAWLTLLPAFFFGLFSVLVPLRLDDLGVGAGGVAAVFLAAAAVEAAASPIIGRVSDRLGRAAPVRFGLSGVLAGAIVIPLAGATWQLAILVVVAAALAGTMWAPAMALLSDGADEAGLPQGLAFGLVNLAWAGGQVLGSAGGSATADATSDGIAYAVVAALCAVTLVALARLVPRGAGAPARASA